MPLLTDLLRLAVVDQAGARVGRLGDLAVVLDEEHPRVTSIRVIARRRRPPPRALPWRAVEAIDESGLRLGPIAHAEPPAGELLLAAEVLDRQLFDAAGKRITRVGDVVLERDGRLLRVAGVETGAAPILRRLGLRRLARRFDPARVDWRALHLLSGPGHALQLDSVTTAVHRFEPHHLAEVAHRAAHPQGAQILAAVSRETAERASRLLAAKQPRRRSSDPLSARKRAPS